MPTSNIISTPSYYFKDNETYLNQANWMMYFNTALSKGFFAQRPCEYNTSTGKLSLKANYTFVNGLFIYYSALSIDPPTQAEDDCLVFFGLDGNNGTVNLYRVTNINQSDYQAVLNELLHYLATDYTALSRKIADLCFGNSSMISAIVPIAYGVYNVGFWDLGRLVTKPGAANIEKITAGYSGTIVAPVCGKISQYGLAQIYGGYKYNIEITDTYTESEYYLYPVPCCSMDNALVRIKNDSGGQVTIKIPTAYNGLSFNLIHDGVWIEDDDEIDYLMSDGDEIVINFAQTYQNRSATESTPDNTPISTYEITQNLKNDDPGEGYTKAEANSLFETKTDAADALALKANTADLGDLAGMDNIDYTSEYLTNKPTLGTMAAENDADADDKHYGRRNNAWFDLDLYYTRSTTISAALKNKADNAALADVYSGSNERYYDTGDVVSHEGRLYKDTHDWTLLNTTQITASGSVSSGAYLYLYAHLYIALSSVSWSKADADAALEYLLQNNFISEVTLAPYNAFKTDYTPGQITTYWTGKFVQLNSTNSRFTEITVEDLIDGLAPLASPELTGTPTAPTPAAADDSTKIATTAFVKNALANISNDPTKVVTFYVNGDTGSDTTGTGAQATPFKTIQKAIDSTRIGGNANVIVLPYEYDETVLVVGKKITISGTANANIRIYGQGINPGIYVSDGGMLTLFGDFSIRGNSSVIQVRQNSTLMYLSRDSGDKLTARAMTTTATQSVISVSSGSSFISNDDGFGNMGAVEITGANNNLTNTGIRVSGGSFIALGYVSVTLSGSGSRGVYSLDSVIIMHNISGNYSTALADIASLVYISNLPNTGSSYAPSSSPSLTGTPTAPTPASGNNSTQIATTAFVQTEISSKANIDNPTFTGTPTAPTAPKATDTTQIATTAFVNDVVEDYAPIASPALTGIPTAPTPASGNNSTQIATTAFVNTEISTAIENILNPDDPDSPYVLTDIYVDWSNGSDTTGTGEQSAPYKTIQKAIDSAFGVFPSNIHIAPAVYDETLTISGKNIRLIGTTNTEIRINSSDNVNPAITVEHGGNLEIVGVFSIYGQNSGLRITDNSTVCFKIINSADKLTIRAEGTAQNTVHRCISVSHGGKFTADGEVDVYIYPNNVVSHGVYAAYGGIVSVNKLVTDIYSNDIALYNDKSFTIVGELTGTYGTAYSNTDGFSKIGNVN